MGSIELVQQRYIQEKPHNKKALERTGSIPTIRFLGVSFPVFMNKIKSYIF